MWWYAYLVAVVAEKYKKREREEPDILQPHIPHQVPKYLPTRSHLSKVPYSADLGTSLHHLGH